MKGFFNRFFGKLDAENRTEEVPTRPAPRDNPVAEDLDIQNRSAKFLEPPQLLVGSAQSAGMQRDHNEDALLTLTATLASDKTQVPFGLYIVADGMGGHKHGEIASSLAVRAVSQHVIQSLYTPAFSPEKLQPADPVGEILREGVQKAHSHIIEKAPGGGTTLTAVLVWEDQLTFAHVGDSRAYVVSKAGEMKPITRDHSLVTRLVELEQITQEEAAVHPQRNVLYRALGQGEPFEPDIHTIPLPYSGYILVCSDGLWGVVPEEELLQILRESAALEQACQRMVAAANEAGGPDNISVILVKLP